MWKVFPSAHVSAVHLWRQVQTSPIFHWVAYLLLFSYECPRVFIAQSSYKYAIYKCIFPACGLPLDSLNSEFRKQVFFIVMLSNLSVFPPWIMLLVLCLKIVGKFKGTQKLSKCSPAPPSTDGAEEVGKSGIWKNPRSIDRFVLCVCVWVFS